MYSIKCLFDHVPLLPALYLNEAKQILFPVSSSEGGKYSTILFIHFYLRHDHELSTIISSVERW